MKKTLLIPILTLAMLLAGGSALAQHLSTDDGPGLHRQGGLHHGGPGRLHHDDRGPHDGLHLPPVERLREIGATEAQIERIQELQDRSGEQAIDLRAAVQKAQLKLRQFRRDAETDETTLYRAIDTLYEAKAELAKNRTRLHLEVRNILGEELVEKLRETRWEARAERGRRGDR